MTQHKNEEYLLPVSHELLDGRTCNAVTTSYRSPTGYWAAEYDGSQVMPLTDEGGEYISIEPEWEEWATERVERDDDLAQYADIILDDWDEDGEHWRWVTTEDANQILDWAETIRKNEIEAA